MVKLSFLFREFNHKIIFATDARIFTNNIFKYCFWVNSLSFSYLIV